MFARMKSLNCVDDCTLSQWLQFYAARKDISGCRRIWSECIKISKLHPSVISCSIMIKELMLVNDSQTALSILLDYGGIENIDSYLCILSHHSGCRLESPSDILSLYGSLIDVQIKKVSYPHGESTFLEMLPQSIASAVTGYLTRGRGDLGVELYQKARANLTRSSIQEEGVLDADIRSPLKVM